MVVAFFNYTRKKAPLIILKNITFNTQITLQLKITQDVVTFFAIIYHKNKYHL